MSARLVHVVNPAAPLVGARVFEFDEPIGVLDALDRTGWKIAGATLLVRDGQLVKRADWNLVPLKDNETATMVTFPCGKGGASQIIAIVAMIALMVLQPELAPLAAGLSTAIGVSVTTATALINGAIMIAGKLLISALMPKPKAPTQTTQSPTYSLSAQSNIARLTQMVPEHFGYFQHVPDLAAAPWTKYVDNNQQIFELFNLGLGEYDIAEVSLADAVIWKDGSYTGIFPEITLQFVGPTGSVTLFADNVVTSPDVSNLSMIGTNEKGYGWLGPFVLSKPGTAASAVEFDILFPGGLFWQHDPLESATVDFKFEAQPIDNSGAPTGDYFTVEDVSITMTTRQPQRFTYRANFTTPGRYRIRGQRTNTHSLDEKASSATVWGGMRGFLPSKSLYPGCTMLALMATSDANLNSNSTSQIKVVKTRKLPIWDPDTYTWSANTATRSPAWAAAYIARSSNGGGLADSRIDLDKLAALDTTWAGRGDWFDGVFDTQQSLYEAIQSVVQVGRTRMIMVGSTMSFVRDEPRSVPRTAFGPRSMLPESFNLNYTLPDVNAVQSLAVTYIDSRIWQPHPVLCKFDDSDDTLETATPITLFGIVDYAHAWREGMAMIAGSRYRRRSADFRTELDGRVCQFGDLVVVSHYMPNWGFSADAVSLEEDDDGDIITLSEPYTPPAGQEDELLLLSLLAPDGQVYGPVECAIVAQDVIDPRTTLVRVEGTATIVGKYAGTVPRDWPVWSDDGLQWERPRAFLGQGTVAPLDALVLKMTPEDGKTTSVSVVIDDARAYTADVGSPPDDPNNPDTAPDYDLIITSVSCAESDGGGSTTDVVLTINGAADAEGVYITGRALPDGLFDVPTYYPGAPVSGVTHVSLTRANGATEFQIGAFSHGGLGPYEFFRVTLDGTDDVAPDDVGTITTTGHWSSGGNGVWTWDDVDGALSYIVTVEERADDGDAWTTARTVEIDAAPYTYYASNELADGGPFVHLRIGVKGKNGAGSSASFTYSDEDP